MRLFGENVPLLKLWVLPFALILSFALFALLRRFAPGMEAPALVATVLSPAVLPAFNFMLDLPELALALAAVAIFLRALDSRSSTLAIAAGPAAGPACPTKHTGPPLPPPLLGVPSLPPP